MKSLAVTKNIDKLQSSTKYIETQYKLCYSASQHKHFIASPLPPIFNVAFGANRTADRLFWLKNNIEIGGKGEVS